MPNDNVLLNKILEQLIQLFELSSRIDTRTDELGRNQLSLKAQLAKLIEDYQKIIEKISHLEERQLVNKDKISLIMDDLHKFEQELEKMKQTLLKLKDMSDKSIKKKENVLSFCAKVLLLVFSAIITYLLYLLGINS